ncbi:MAG: zinc ribbon domain-containing protein [Methanoregula sp.]|jgi:hypothetical protein|uniref:zinc ribbon domain-containing protein n=1 Tax=Methanoregula sp. TaxID=2052170 RepID=UPI003D0C67E0
MQGFDRDDDEEILLRADNIHIKSRSLGAYLTNKNIVLIDRESASVRRIPLLSLSAMERSENAIRDPVIVFSVGIQTGGIRQVWLTFTQSGGGSRRAERDAWIRQIQVILMPPPDKRPSADSSGTSRENLPGSRRGTDRSGVSGHGGELGTYCTRCGLKVSDAAAFCERCGSRIIRYGGVAEPAPDAGFARAAEKNHDEILVIDRPAPEPPAQIPPDPRPPEPVLVAKRPKSRRKLFLIAGIVVILVIVFVILVLPKTGPLAGIIPNLTNLTNLSNHTASNVTANVKAVVTSRR